jgi:hypothetical protein
MQKPSLGAESGATGAWENQYAENHNFKKSHFNSNQTNKIIKNRITFYNWD